MPPITKAHTRLAAVLGITMIGTVSAVMHGVTVLMGLNNDGSLITVAASCGAGLAGWLTTPNGTDTEVHLTEEKVHALLRSHVHLQPAPERVDGNGLPGGGVGEGGG